MRKARRFAPFLALLLLAAATASASHWFRSAETPPWGGEKSRNPQGTADKKSHEPARRGEDLTPFTFLTYNVKNWLVSSQSPEKTPESKQAIIRILSDAAPDVIGICEIGSPDDVAEIQSMLSAMDMDFPYMHHCGGVDRVRHLALLSRFPIVSTETHDPGIPGTGHSMQRGILDATVNIGGREIRFIGLHLKSKRIVPDFDQALLRVEEAGHARKHIDAIIAEDADALVVAYGDFNDTTRSLSSRAIYGTYRTPGYMNPIHVKDSRGETWTHRYAVQDSYTRIDFVTVSRVLKRHVDREESKVIDDPLWEIASDHRPVVVRFE
jgi:endonuclease/exonuclease/phosphatase family metal-dependent hydrolase